MHHLYNAMKGVDMRRSYPCGCMYIRTSSPPLPNMYVLLFALVCVCGAEIMPIGDNSYPYVYLMDPPIPVLWNKRFFYMRMATSQAIRINSRGIRYIPSDYTPVFSNDTSVPFMFQGGRHSAWYKSKCSIAQDSLCHIKDELFTRSRLFPTPGSPVYITHGNIGEWERKHLSMECPEFNTGRTSSVALGVMSANPMWDVSLCNVLGAGGDYVYFPYREELYVLSKPISFQVLVLISGMTVLMTIVLAHNLEHTIGSKQDVNPSLSIIGMTILLLTVSFATGSPNVLESYVTLEDRLAFVVLFCYVSYYILQGMMTTIMNTARWSPVNPIMATLGIVVMRIYGTLDNPYCIVLGFLICCRFMHRMGVATRDVYLPGKQPVMDSSSKKIDSLPLQTNREPRLYYFERIMRTLCLVDMIADSVVVSTIVYVGVVPQHSNDPGISALYILQGLFAAVATGTVMLSIGQDP